ncbi:MAG: PEP-CTERM sorting domain-containing protein [Planctomycetales bacterium]|nr:PEP-CTERM sorting domain-containing protein [Planctomycetales bacterium]
MRFCTLAVALGVAVCMASATHAAFNLTWDGGDGMWFSQLPTDPTGQWNGGQNIQAVVGRENGHEGYKDSTGAADILIGTGDKVSFDGFTISQDFRLLQGDNMTITNGSVWEQKTLDADEVHPQFGQLFRWEETRWTEMEMSNLNLDNGTFRRTGGSTFDPTDAGGGALIFGSWKGDDNQANFDQSVGTPTEFNIDGFDFLNWQTTKNYSASELRKFDGTFGQSPSAQTSNINITNGGSLENEGQIWFGSDVDIQTNINLNINNGSVTAIGGLDATPGPIGGDIPGGDASIVIFDWFGRVSASINFTGPGSITTDEGAIRMLDETATVTDMTYEDLWNAGILKANGGNAGLFTDHFSVTGSWGDPTYTLTSLLPLSGGSFAAAVPEPTTALMAGMLALTALGVRRRRS